MKTRSFQKAEMRKIYKNNISQIATMEFLVFDEFEFAKFYSLKDTVHDYLHGLLK